MGAYAMKGVAAHLTLLIGDGPTDPVMGDGPTDPVMWNGPTDPVMGMDQLIF